MKQLRLENDPLEKEKFLQRLDQSLHTNGVIDLLRKGFRYKHLVLDMFYVRPSPGNETAAKLYAQNIFSVTAAPVFPPESTAGTGCMPVSEWLAHRYHGAEESAYEAECSGCCKAV